MGSEKEIAVTQEVSLENHSLKKKAISTETFVFIGVSAIIVIYLAIVMGIGNMFSVMMKTAHDLLLNTAFFIMSVAVLAGGASAVLSEFGIIALANRLVAPIMRPLFNLPGAASLAAVTTYISDNPAVLPLAEDKGFSKYFKNYEIAALTNLGTTFGMGLIVTSFVIGLGNEYILSIIIGNIGAVFGGIVSVRLMLRVAKKYYNVKEDTKEDRKEKALEIEYRDVRPGNAFERILGALLDGGKNGVQLGLSVIPGILLVCTLVMMLTFGPSTENGVEIYKGAAYEGVALLPKIGNLFSFIIKPLFGFKTAEALALPITSLGAVGAAMGMSKGLLAKALMDAHDIAVFAAMGICWSGFLSTHVGMMDSLGLPKLASKAMLTHLIGGLAAGVFANYLYKLAIMFLG